MCNLIGIGIGLFFVLIGSFFLYLNTKDNPKYFKLLSLISMEAGMVLLGLFILIASILSVLGIGSSTCDNIFV